MPRVIAARRFAYPLAFVALIALASSARAQAAVADAPAKTGTTTLASVFSSHMVLQRDMEIPIWGKAEKGATVTVKMGSAEEHAIADADGHWRLDLPSMPAGGPHEVVVSTGGDKVTLSDVLIGDVWVASGQSNMEWPVKNVNDAEKEIAAADYPQIRFIMVPHQTGKEPMDSFKTDGWKVCKPDTIGPLSGVGFFFARDLNKQLKVPIGIINCNFGGTQMEAWTSRKALESSWTFQPYLKTADATPPAKAHDAPASLFNGMTATVIPYAIRGVIWYQGESNAGRYAQYAELSKLMIADWREHWGQGDFPFLLVQLAGYNKNSDTWPMLREAQADTLESPNVGMATAIDIGNETDIHPKNKQEVGRRLALVARAIAYGENLVYSGPAFREAKADGGKVRVSFNHMGGGLKADGDLKGFEVAGADGKFVPAKATIEGDQVVATGEGVSAPTQARYDWAPFPDGNLKNAEGLPAVPFRSQR